MNTTNMVMRIMSDGKCPDTPVIRKIYDEGVRKFMPLAGEGIVFMQICVWCYKKLAQRKQNLHTALLLAENICRAVGEDFYEGIVFEWELHNSNPPKNYRDIFMCIFPDGY